MGPVEWIEISFPGSKFNGDIVPALKQLVESGTVGIIDLLVLRKDQDGVVTALEVDALDPGEGALFDQLQGDIGGLLSEDDIAYAGASLAPDSTTALIVWENLWARSLAEAVRAASGSVVAHDRIPDAVVQAALQSAAAQEESA